MLTYSIEFTQLSKFLVFVGDEYSVSAASSQHPNFICLYDHEPHHRVENHGGFVPFRFGSFDSQM